MVGPSVLTDPDVLVLLVIALCYLAVRALAVYDRVVDSNTGGSSTDSDAPRSP